MNIVCLLHGIEAEEDRPTPFCMELKPKKTGQHFFPPLTGANTFVVLTTFFFSMCLAARCHASIASTVAHF